MDNFQFFIASRLSSSRLFAYSAEAFIELGLCCVENLKMKKVLFILYQVQTSHHFHSIIKWW
jgi:hypothetical protein